MVNSSFDKNPRGGANCLSIILLWWMKDLLRLGNKRPLTGKDLFPPLDAYKAEFLVEKAETNWLEEVKRSNLENRKPRLWKAIIRVIPWKTCFILAILRLFSLVAFGFTPVCLWLVLITLNSGPDMNYTPAFLYVALLGVTLLVKSLSSQHFDYLSELWGLKLKVATIGLVYKKILGLSRQRLEETLSGNTINLVSNDAQKIEKAVQGLGMVLSSPLEIGSNLFILWYFIGWQTLVGAGLFFLLAIFQILMTVKAASLRGKAAGLTDRRLVLMKEVISGIRAVKMYAWEWNFRDFVWNLRSLEMKIIRLKGSIVTMFQVLYFTSPSLSMLVSVTALILSGTTLTSFMVFTLLSGLVVARFIFSISLGHFLLVVADARVALNRTQRFLVDEVFKDGREMVNTFSENQLSQSKGRTPNEVHVKVINSKRDPFTKESHSNPTNASQKLYELVPSSEVEDPPLKTFKDDILANSVLVGSGGESKRDLCAEDSDSNTINASQKLYELVPSIEVEDPPLKTFEGHLLANSVLVGSGGESKRDLCADDSDSNTTNASQKLYELVPSIEVEDTSLETFKDHLLANSVLVGSGGESKQDPCAEDSHSNITNASQKLYDLVPSINVEDTSLQTFKDDLLANSVLVGSGGESKRDPFAKESHSNTTNASQKLYELVPPSNVEDAPLETFKDDVVVNGVLLNSGGESRNNDLVKNFHISMSLASCSWTNNPSTNTIHEVSCTHNTSTNNIHEIPLTNNTSTDLYTIRDISLEVSKGELMAITGPVGSGKSSLLMAVIRELPLSKGNISCHGKIAFVPQMPWVFSGAVRENILFGLPYIEDKFQHVIKTCRLRKDLADFSNGDQTEIGQRGASLSGGQKARVGLARAVYSEADIYLLDDPLSAVDAKVGRKLFESCILGALSGRIRLLVTHQLQYLKDVDRIVVMENGAIVHRGRYAQLKATEAFSRILKLPTREEEGVEFLEINVMDRAKAISSTSLAPVSCCGPEQEPDIGLKEEEELQTTGAVTWRLYWALLREGASSPLIVLLICLLLFAQVCLLAPNWWLARMAEMPRDEQKQPITSVIHACLVAASLGVMSMVCFFLYHTVLKASENLHNKMAMAIIKAPVLFFDTNPAGRILNRFSKDVGCIDEVLPPEFQSAVQFALLSISAILVPAVTNYWIFLALVPVLVLFVSLVRYYLKSSRELKRIEAIRCSPVYSHIAETVTGLEIVHSSNMEAAFLDRLYRYLDENTQAFFLVVSCGRWLGLRLDLLSSVFVTIVAAAAILIGGNPTLAGLALTYALQTLGGTQHGLRMASHVETLMTSVERVMAYTKLDPEPGYSTETLAPEAWPKEGILDLQDLSLVYMEGGPRVLNDISLFVSGKEKVGVVGRTGAGKSSLVSALFRMPEPSGKVFIDGVDVGTLNLQVSRSSMAVITQDPVLFGGSLRRNLDPFSKYGDQEIWTALEQVQLKELIQNLPGQLKFHLKESGANFSVGERQLVCLARALLQRSKIIIMDEATANVDFKTDRLIQEVIRSKFQDSTVVTIAHRLNTIIDYDKVLVLDGGRVVEFDKPDVLLNKRDGLFAELVRSHEHNEL